MIYTIYTRRTIVLKLNRSKYPSQTYSVILIIFINGVLRFSQDNSVKIKNGHYH